MNRYRFIKCYWMVLLAVFSLFGVFTSPCYSITLEYRGMAENDIGGVDGLSDHSRTSNSNRLRHWQSITEIQDPLTVLSTKARNVDMMLEHIHFCGSSSTGPDCV